MIALTDGQIAISMLAAWGTLLLFWWACNLVLDYAIGEVRRRRVGRHNAVRVPCCQGCGKPTPWPVRACDSCSPELVITTYGKERS